MASDDGPSPGMLGVLRLAEPYKGTFALVLAAALFLAYVGNLVGKLFGRKKPAAELAGRRVEAAVSWEDPAAAASSPDQGQRLTVALSGSPAHIRRGQRSAKRKLIDLHGKDLPAVAALALPLPGATRLGQFRLKINDERALDTNDESSALLGTLSCRVAPATVHDQLDKLIAKGDNLLIIELLHECKEELNDQSLVNAALRPSWLKQSLLGNNAKKHQKSGGDKHGPKVVGTEAPSDEELSAAYACRRSEGALVSRAVQWLLCPMFGIVACWLLMMNTSAVLAWLPSCPGLGWVENAPDLIDVMPAFPQTMLEAFDLGQISYQLAHNDTADHPALLDAAEEVLGKKMEREQLLQLREALVEVTGRRTLWQRLTSLFTFINLMWFGAIIGIAVSVGPVVWMATKPIRRWMTGTLKRVVIYLATEVVVPIVTRLHLWGIIEACLYFVAIIIIAHGSRVPAGPGLYIALTGIVALKALFAYSTLFRGRAIVEMYGEVLVHWTPALPAVAVLPLAVVHQSTLLGYAVVGCVLSLLGLKGGAGYLCIFIGFRGKNAAIRTSIACAAGLLIFVGIRATGIDAEFLAPFVSGVSVLGGVGHYLSLLILSAQPYSSYGGKRNEEFWLVNTMMVVSLLTSAFCGRMFDMPGLANTATVFASLYVMERYAEFHFKMG
eukprot:SAG22_NODE_1628_length_3953_cov_2.906591_2_plen_668_part_00